MKRFYDTVAVKELAGVFAVTLDGREIKTPQKQLLAIPVRELAQAVAAEWVAQEDDILPDSMPLTRMSNTALDRVGPRREIVINELVNYAHTDLLCYREDAEQSLIKQQEEHWQTVLDWLDGEHDIHLLSTSGILPITQNDKAIARLSAIISQLSDFELTAFHALVTGFGSISLGLALIKGFRNFDECWNASILEQSFQEEAWGTDSEVDEKRTELNAEMQMNLTFWRLLQG
ncbi:ATP12 family chaperone protein [Kordiimonas aquimaris]|uniref:ATP12 family chaperone protein n=1 Tax=Kordiimonas aquimaris TaxID=707591 RepID=UPI0021CE1DEE|nr:ATP12 family protein [Kordiimonas aquimaris]